MSIASTLDKDVLAEAVELLRNGGLVAFPTDTVYGLAVRPSDDGAVEKLFAAKRRAAVQPTPILIASPRDLALLVEDVPDFVQGIIREFWPGALTIVLRRAPAFHSKALDGDSVGVRVPDHPIPQELLRLLGEPITGTSANLAGGAEPLTANDVRSQLGDTVDFVIDGGRCRGGAPSTVIDCTQDPARLLRPGPISREELVRAAGRQID